ncbi:MAG: MerR family transcriptional regulator [Acidobacteriota bacterium]
MNKKLHRVQEVAEIAGVSVRTLHHYDSIGLLIPVTRTDAGYRQYDDDNLLRLQEILICREFGMSLDQIQRSLEDPSYERAVSLQAHREQLFQRLRRTEGMIRSVDLALEALRTEAAVHAEDLFGGFDPSRYAEEVKKRWGNSSAYRESQRRVRGYDKQDWAKIRAENDDILERMVKLMQSGAAPDDSAAMDLAERHRYHMDHWYYSCTHSIHSGLAHLYETDLRFAASFEEHAEGLAAFLAAAIRANSARFETSRSKAGASS